MKVLLIDDDRFLAGIYGRFFSEDGWEVRSAISGEDGLKQIERDAPDLIVMDVLLPEMDGYEFIEQVRATPNLSALPIMIYSQLGQREDVDRAIECGASAYLIKAHATPQCVLRKANEILCSV